MITKRTVKMGKECFLEYVDDDTGERIKQIPLDEAEYKNETIKILADGHMKDNQGVTHREAFLAVSKKYPDLFNLNETKVKSDDVSDDVADNVRNDLINEFMDQNKDVSYKEAVLAVSKRRPDLFTTEARTWQ